MRRSKKLHEIILQQYGYEGIENQEIPYYITDNLNRELRSYQEEAIKYFLLQRQMINASNHLMFNMATGSGKTLVMAALMLECYAMGYRDFIFFVNSTSIIEKTKQNFSDILSSKYLFKQQININSTFIDIRIIEHFAQSQDNSINIYFTTVQSIFSALKYDRENALCINDFIDRKIVFLADEAHHLNADTKRASKKELQHKEGWEAIIKRAYESHDENLMLEFSATIPRDANILKKYNDKIIYEYDLARFCNDGYSKRIFVIRYECRDLSHRFLGAILLSLFRELIAQKYGIALKPVLLFKSETIHASKENQALFIDFVSTLHKDSISSFYDSLQNASKENLLARSLVFFKESFGEDYLEILARYLRNNFNREYIINTNDDKEFIQNQDRLNSLEDANNPIRIIFSVDKLNEGWDVLNLFDIVRLGSSNSNAASTKEAQLIGRGARYFPFISDMLPLHEHLLYKRKYDNNPDSDLSMLEKLSYHTLNEVDFIKNLNKSMQQQGLLLNEAKKQKRVSFSTNNDINISNIISAQSIGDEIKVRMQHLKIPLFSLHINEEEARFHKAALHNKGSQIKSADNIHTKYFLKAMNMAGLGFNEIQEILDYPSKREFIESYIHNMHFCFDNKQEFNVANNIEIAKFIIDNFKMHKEKIKRERKNKIRF